MLRFTGVDFRAYQINSEINEYVKGETNMEHKLTFFIGLASIVISIGLFVQMLTVGA